MRDGLIIACVYGTAAFAIINVRHLGLEYDAHAYWLAWRHPTLYGGEPHQRNAFLYSPAFAQAIWPLSLLGWQLFAALWATMTTAVFLWLVWPLARLWRLLAMVLLLPEITAGNIWALLALVLVFGLRHPSAWSFAVLTKVTVAVGFVWFAVRREWRQLAVAVVATAVITATSAVASAGLWRQWVALLAHGSGHYTIHSLNVPPVVRFPAALALIVFAARRGRPAWLVPAMMLATPLFYLNTLALMAALPRLGLVTVAPSTRNRPRQAEVVASEPPWASRRPY